MAIDGDPGRRGPEDRRAALLLPPLLVAAIAIVAVFFVFYQAEVVVGPSMLPALRPGDRLLLTRGYGPPRFGDIVVFRTTTDGQPTDVVKRVIGLPGDEVLVVDDIAWVNGRREPTAYETLAGDGPERVGPVTVPAGELFVLGDNRGQSLDSRYTGTVPLEAVKGRAVAVFSPITRVRRIDAVTTGE